VGRERYDVLELIGEGATGVVYRATDGATEVALKVLLAVDPVSQRRFAREARLAAATSSRHLVQIIEVGEDYLVMPLYRGGSLAATLASGDIALDDLLRFAAELAQGLDALHAQGVVHRDVKPSNVLLDERRSAVLTDFGLARGADSTQLTREGQLVGSVHYLAPELIEGHAASTASDIYAFGCLVYECLAGVTPFAGRADSEVGYAHLVDPPPDPRAHRPELSADLAAAVLTALTKDPKMRPTTATALARMLHLAGRPSPAGSVGG
jgi:serine/threonine protein kinase, bacterial